MHTRLYNQRLPKVDRFPPPSSNIPLPSEPATNANKRTNDRFSDQPRQAEANQRFPEANQSYDATTMNITGRYNKRLPKVDRFSPPPSNIHLPSESATNANKQTTDSTRKRATHQRQQRKQKQQWKQQDKPKLRTIFEKWKAHMQSKDKKKNQYIQQQQERQQHKQLKLVHQELLQEIPHRQIQQQVSIYYLEMRLSVMKKLRILIPQQVNDAINKLVPQHCATPKTTQQYEQQQVFNHYECVLQQLHDQYFLYQLRQTCHQKMIVNDEINQQTFESLVSKVSQPCAPPKTTQLAPTQTQQLQWKYGFIMHQMLTTVSYKAHREMLQSVHNELTTNRPIIDATNYHPPTNTVSSFYNRQHSPTIILRCLLPMSFGFTHCNSYYYFHKLRPPDNITPVKQHLTNPFDTLYFFSKVRPPDEDNTVVQQQHSNPFGNSYFFSKVRPRELTLHV